jgi:hypothetical protein
MIRYRQTQPIAAFSYRQLLEMYQILVRSYTERECKTLIGGCFLSTVIW